MSERSQSMRRQFDEAAGQGMVVRSDLGVRNGGSPNLLTKLFPTAATREENRHAGAMRRDAHTALEAGGRATLLTGLLVHDHRTVTQGVAAMEGIVAETIPGSVAEAVAASMTLRNAQYLQDATQEIEHAFLNKLTRR